MDWLLSEEFVTFSQRIADIYTEKKKIKADLKDFYEKAQGKLKELEAQAQTLQEEFEKWKPTNHDIQLALMKYNEVRNVKYNP